jgi:hypothetical protein
MIRPLIAIALAMTLHLLPLSGQTDTIRGRVQSVLDSRAVAGAAVRARLSGATTTTNQSGDFALPSSRRSDTIVVRAFGFAPDTVAWQPGGASLLITLRLMPVALQDLVTATNDNAPIASGDATHWTVSGQAAKVLPVAGEPDINRSLALVPGVSFSSLLSARPMLRGLDADDAGYSIDGFDAINLYHLGRFFSAVPSIAVDHADVQFQPADPSSGGTTAGSVDITGKTGTERAVDAQYGLGALSSSIGTGGAIPIFAAARSVRLTLADIVQGGGDVRYSFWDTYEHATLPHLARGTEFSLFASNDDVGPGPGSDIRDVSMRWSNLVAGIRSHLLSSSSGSVTAAISYASHEEHGDQIPARTALINVDNRMHVLHAEISGSVQTGIHGVVFRFGGDGKWRDMVNVLQPDSLEGFFATDNRIRRVEGGAYQQLECSCGPTSIQVGVREDLAGPLIALQPRARVATRVGARGSIALSVGRTERLFHLVSDARSEPKVAYYDIWLPAGVGGIPAAIVDHATLDFARDVGVFHLRAGIFAATGSGEVDLQPVLTNADSGSIFRIGSLRVHGLDLSAVGGSPSGRWSIAASYAYTRSERNWGSGWIPWLNERRHQLGVFGSVVPGLGIRLSGSAQLSSSVPYTPIAGWYTGTGVNAGNVQAVYGPENSATGAGWFRFDGSITKEFGGPGHTHWEAGLSIVNWSRGDQAPRKPYLSRSGDGITIGSDPLFHLPPVPSIILRGHWSPND